MNTTYDFPVSLQKVYTKAGKEMPTVRAVVRDDTNEPIANVSNKYRLIPHMDVINAARGFISKLGTPTEGFHIAKNGALIVGEYVYKDITHAVKDDFVGLRVFIENSYNAKKRLTVKIGGLVLKCTNGMVVPRDIYSMSIRHTGDNVIEWPDHGEILDKFGAESKKWIKYGQHDLKDKYDDYLHKAVTDGVIHERALQAPTHGTTVWDLYNQFTYHITHNESQRASQIGKIHRSEKVANWLEEIFV